MVRSEMANSLLRFLYTQQLLSEQILKKLRNLLFSPFSLDWTRPTVSKSAVFNSTPK